MPPHPVFEEVHVQATVGKVDEGQLKTMSIEFHAGVSCWQSSTKKAVALPVVIAVAKFNLKTCFLIVVLLALFLKVLAQLFTTVVHAVLVPVQPLDVL